MRKFLACVFLAALAALAAPRVQAQSTTVVTATVTDPNGIPYANATVKAQITPSTGSPCVMTGGNCVPIQSTVGPIPLNAAGSFTMNLYPNASISPSGTQWLFTISITPGSLPPIGTGPQTFSVPLTISGATEDISSQLDAVAPDLSVIFNLGPDVPPGSAMMAPKQGLVQSATGENGNNGAIPAVALVNNVSAGNMLLACEVGFLNAAPTNISVTDTLGSSWTELPSAEGSYGQIQCFSAKAATSGADSAQFAITGVSGIYITILFSEYAGVDTLDQTVSATSTGSGNLTTTYPNEMLIAVATNTITGNYVWPIMQPGAGYALREVTANGNANNTSLGTILEDAAALTAGTYSASFNVGGYGSANTPNPLIQLFSFYSSVKPQASFRPLAWSDLPQQPLNLNCNNFSFSLGCFSLQSPLGIGDTPSRISFYSQSCNQGIFTGSYTLYTPICIEIPTINSNDKQPLMWLAAGGNGTNCVSGWRIDGDGYFVWDGSCGLALTMPLTQIFGGARISNNQNTAIDDLLIGPSAAKTSGAVIVDMYDSANTEFFKAPDLESSTNPPQFPVGLSDAQIPSGDCVQSGTNSVFVGTACGAGILAYYSTTLSSDISLTANTVTTVVSQAVTMPSSGCPCRAIVSYGLYWFSGTNNGSADAAVTDGTNIFATSQAIWPATNNTGGQNGFQISPVTYADSANVTFTLEVETNAGGNSVKAAPLLFGQNTHFEIQIVTSN